MCLSPAGTSWLAMAISRGVLVLVPFHEVWCFFLGDVWRPNFQVRCISVTKQKSPGMAPELGPRENPKKRVYFTQIWICEVEKQIEHHSFQQVFTHGHVKIVAGFQTKKLQEVACCHHGP